MYMLPSKVPYPNTNRETTGIVYKSNAEKRKTLVFGDNNLLLRTIELGVE